jgi:hypothetical protein
MWTERWVFVSASHGSRSSAPSRNLTPDLQGHAGPCMLGSPVPRLLGKCPPGWPSLSPPPRHAPIPALACYTCSMMFPSPAPLTIDFPCGPLALPFSPYIACCFQLGLSLQKPVHAGSSLADFSTLKMEAIRSSETSVHTRSTRRHIPENGILHSHCRENLKSYNKKLCLSIRHTQCR